MFLNVSKINERVFDVVIDSSLVYSPCYSGGGIGGFVIGVFSMSPKKHIDFFLFDIW